eukprot:scaffold142728_cov32-Tisochrysis_lutea.AAC.5
MSGGFPTPHQFEPVTAYSMERSHPGAYPRSAGTIGFARSLELRDQAARTKLRPRGTSASVSTLVV